jgi:hypothetical protein
MNGRGGRQGFQEKNTIATDMKPFLMAYADYFPETRKRSADLAGQTGRDIPLLRHKPGRVKEIYKVFEKLLVPLASTWSE